LKNNQTYILCIETANAVTSIGIALNGECLCVKEVLESNKAADVLHTLIEELFVNASITFKDLNAIAISAGPGSYTGLRIAAAAAKGYCYALNIPLIAINTLQAMVHGIQTRYNHTNYDVYVPMIDARRMEVFTSFFSKNAEIIQSYTSLIIDTTSPNLFSDNNQYLLFGNGALKAKEIFTSPNIFIIDNFVPSSKDLFLQANLLYIQQRFENLAYFEPSYTKAFYTTAK
jgi:tRNA threonylcarbamoyladenosine biosynthesis protein TsaB